MVALNLAHVGGFLFLDDKHNITLVLSYVHFPNKIYYARHTKV